MAGKKRKRKTPRGGSAYLKREIAALERTLKGFERDYAITTSERIKVPLGITISTVKKEIASLKNMARNL